MMKGMLTVNENQRLSITEIKKIIQENTKMMMQ